jgi:hypothetical protein
MVSEIHAWLAIEDDHPNAPTRSANTFRRRHETAAPFGTLLALVIKRPLAMAAKN